MWLLVVPSFLDGLLKANRSGLEAKSSNQQSVDDQVAYAGRGQQDKISCRSWRTMQMGHGWLIFCFCYVVSLRSSEGLMVDIAVIQEFGEAVESHVVIPLLGQVKG